MVSGCRGSPVAVDQNDSGTVSFLCLDFLYLYIIGEEGIRFCCLCAKKKKKLQSDWYLAREPCANMTRGECPCPRCWDSGETEVPQAPAILYRVSRWIRGVHRPLLSCRPEFVQFSSVQQKQNTESQVL